MQNKHTSAGKSFPWHGVLRAIFILLYIAALGAALGFAATILHQRDIIRGKQKAFLQEGFTITLGDKQAHVIWENDEQLLKDIRKTLAIETSPAKSAILRRQGNSLVIDKDEPGTRINTEKILQDAKGRLRTLSHAPIDIELLVEEPEIREEAIRSNMIGIRGLLFSPITLITPESKEVVRPWSFFESLELQKKKPTPSILADMGSIKDNNTTLPFYIHIRSDQFDPYAQKTWGYMNQKTSDVKIYTNEKKKPAFEGKGKNGKTLQVQELKILLEKAINNGNAKIQLPIQEEQFQVIVDASLQAQGIKDVISIGHTTFYGSPTNRMFNIGVGIQKFNGILVAPGEIFSFNDNLGEVDDRHGFRKELVIKPEGTIPEFGGGICQVSTTAYRAALYAGLPIVERSPHSYAVMYYAQVGGHGIDATIYPGARDLRFKNDTPGSILIQAYMEGSEAYFIFYGTKDGRTVRMDGPYISNRHSEGGTETVQTTDIPAGTKKQVEKAHVGFDTVWYRYITNADGLTAKETLESRYHATKDKVLIGVSKEELEKAQPKKSDNKSFGD